jgi:hypothetical protein
MMVSGLPVTRVLKRSFNGPYSVEKEKATRDEWILRILRRIRQICSLKQCAGFWPALENLVWGLAPGSTILILVLAVLCARMYLNLGHDYVHTVTAHLEKVSLGQLLGYEA